MECAFINSSITKKASHDGIEALILHGKCYPSSYWHLRGYDCIASHESQFIAPHMHRAALAFATPGDFPKKFRHYYSRVHTFGDGMSMLTVTGKNLVISSQRRDSAYANSLLTYIKVHKAAYFTTCIDRKGTRLNSSHRTI